MKKDKATLGERVNALRLIPDALSAVRIHLPQEQKTIPNQDGKRNSLLIYAAIATNDGYIGSVQAARGLEIFGEELRAEARAARGMHPNIDILEDIVRAGSKVRVDVLRNYAAKPIPAGLHQALPAIIKEFDTPFHVYDEKGIRDTARDLNAAFSWVPVVGLFEFRNYFAVKALPNPRILEILAEEKMGADCSSLPELQTAQRVGLKGEEIMFTSNDTPAHEFAFAQGLGAIINFDDLTHIEAFRHAIGRVPELACCRYNPGNLKEGNDIIGNPTEAKYGFTREQLHEGFKQLKKMGAGRFGLHTMVASNELNPSYFAETARIVFDTIAALSSDLGIRFEFANLGGGIGTPYKPEQQAASLPVISAGVKRAYNEIIVKGGFAPLRIMMENGRMVTGPSGFLISKVLHVSRKHKDYVGLDACMAHLARPAMYGAYHHITVLGKEEAAPTCIYDVTGSLCENNDKFAINRVLPPIKVGDIVVIHNSGAHAHAMGGNYNAKLRGAEILYTQSGTPELIRRAETPADYFATLRFVGSRFSDTALS